MFLTKQDKKILRSQIFRHLDGIVTAPSAYILAASGILDHLSKDGRTSLTVLTDKFHANEGYLNVALKTLCSQGWLIQDISKNHEDILFEMTPKGKVALKYIPAYEKAVEYIPFAIRMQDFILNGFNSMAFTKLKELFNEYNKRFDFNDPENDLEGEVQDQILKHIEGIITGPLIVSLGINGLFHEYFSVAPFEVEEFSQHHNEVKAIVDFFVDLGWFSKKGNVYNFTKEGLFFARRATAYGVTVSYLPMFAKLNELIFGNPNVLWLVPENSPEIHVDRYLNVWGSGGAHTSYFKKVDEIILDIFNRPLDQQPKGFLDMGCGNGAFMEHIFNVIWKQSLRGKHLEDYPLFIVGADYNQEALNATRSTLNRAEIWAKVVKGDIGKPEILANELQEKYEIFLGDLLNVRSFLDHNRIYETPKILDPSRQSNSKGAFSFRGRRIPNNEVEQNLIEHLKNWAPYVKKFGLLIIELHSLDPMIAANHIGETAVTAYDATHGFSDQYILELDSFMNAADAANLHPVPKYQIKFPNNDLATVSINLLVSKQ